MKKLKIIKILAIAIIVFVDTTQTATTLDNKPAEESTTDVIVVKPIQQDHQNFTGLFNDIKKLKLKKSQNEIKQITTVGLLSGALKVEKNMKSNLQILVKQFYDNFNTSTHDENMEKIFSLEETMERDKRAIQILSNALDYARDGKSYEEYKNEMESIAKDVSFCYLNSNECE